MTALRPFALGEVTLGPGLLADKARLMLDHLRSYDTDRLLRAFRENAGLPTPDVPRPGGWEDPVGEANGNLRGHYTGHFLSALAQASASTRDPTYGEKLERLIAGLAECADESGYLAAYPDKQFVVLETMTEADYTVVWAPYYTAHKLVKGLLDAHLALGELRPLELAEGMCRWMYERLRRLPPAVLHRMWSLHGSGEYGGLAETLCDLYSVTGEPDWLDFGRLLDIEPLISACTEGLDVLDGLHANQHIPIFTGLVRRFDVTGEDRYLHAAANFWDQIVPGRTYSIGGTSSNEFWGPAGIIAGSLSETNAETCCAHNLLKLSRLLFFHLHDPKYVEYYERTLYNQILGSKQDEFSADRPLTTYFIGLEPGSVRDYLPKAGATCCEGTGLESATKYQDFIYCHSDDGLYVNLYSASSVSWAGVTVIQTTDFPYEQGPTLTFDGAGSFTLHLRIPAWTSEFQVTVNGAAVHPDAGSGGYLGINRVWSTGDTVRVDLPFRVRAEPTPDGATLSAVMSGPIHLIALDNRRELLEAAELIPMPGEPLHFLADSIEFVPFFEGTTHPFHSYVRTAATP
ncbi:beta-L-arabinofuranosidase domain-containing protein [Kribbella sp. NPDC006257]|uniref:beta-L-arabinofuranosidase domain-containing protein n=1 Tax=Kribbella sp. NPDC006257 TaxID=3156738 RepID=UPI0033AFD093